MQRVAFRPHTCACNIDDLPQLLIMLMLNRLCTLVVARVPCFLKNGSRAWLGGKKNDTRNHGCLQAVKVICAHASGTAQASWLFCRDVSGAQTSQNQSPPKSLLQTYACAQKHKKISENNLHLHTKHTQTQMQQILFLRGAEMQHTHI
jgi:hypothetical protein